MDVSVTGGGGGRPLVRWTKGTIDERKRDVAMRKSLSFQFGAFQPGWDNKTKKC